ncbi:hypothetical protein [Rathayibacter tritici]|uniref:hypothetical protein n=1 Tax=Rathayibacter tritici TaxID=33888 RepID=UPI0011B0A364|nr:hypothetical protein [Rathayibacter tritici]
MAKNRLSSSAKASRIVAPTGTVSERRTAASVASGRIVIRAAMSGHITSSSSTSRRSAAQAGRAE